MNIYILIRNKFKPLCCKIGTKVQDIVFQFSNSGFIYFKGLLNITKILTYYIIYYYIYILLSIIYK